MRKIWNSLTLILILQSKNQKIQKSIGQDFICPYWLKKANSKLIRHYLLKVIKSVYKNGIFPRDFNLCKVRPIKKDFIKASHDISITYI